MISNKKLIAEKDKLIADFLATKAGWVALGADPALFDEQINKLQTERAQLTSKIGK
jgi:hypothetical protein